MENGSIRLTLSIKRTLGRRDAMHQMVSPSKITDGHRWQHYCVFGGDDVSKLSSSELAPLLSAIMDEIGASYGVPIKRTVATGGASSIVSPRAKKRPRSVNDHSILLFIERVMHERFSSFQQTDGYINKELKAYFGVEDVSFLSEDQIICLVFLITLHLIKQCLGHENASSGEEFKVSDIPDLIPADPIIDTALRVIDFIVSISKRERVDRRPLSSKKKQSSDSPTHLHISCKRRRYQHLLQDEQTRRDETKQTHNSILSTIPSAIEEKYPNQWTWIVCFRKKYRQQEAMKFDSPSDPIHGTHIYDHQSCNEEQGASDAGDEAHHTMTSHDNDMKGTCGNADGSITSLNVDIDYCKDDTNKTRYKPEKTDELTEPHSAVSPLDELDVKAHKLRKSLITMPPSDLSHAVDHIAKSIVDLLKQYGNLNGASGVERCGGVVNGIKTVEQLDLGSPEKNFHLSDKLVSLVTKDFLTDATGALRANAFLRTFVLPLMLEMNPITSSVKGLADKGKPASRLMTSLLVSLARDRPIECVESVLIPTLMSEKDSSIEPNRFQCELISRVLKGKDSLSLSAIALFLEMILSPNNSSYGMIWTEQSMPLVSACLNRQPQLSDAVVALLVNRVEQCLSPTAPLAMRKSMKLSTLFHALASKYGQQIKAIDRVEALVEAASHLKTFMGKTIRSLLQNSTE